MYLVFQVSYSFGVQRRDEMWGRPEGPCSSVGQRWLADLEQLARKPVQL